MDNAERLLKHLAGTSDAAQFRAAFPFPTHETSGNSSLQQPSSCLLQQQQQSTDNTGRFKIRKPYTITKQRERWSDDEHLKFLEALRLYGRAWRKIEEYIGTKTAVQIRSHAQKFFSKLERKRDTGDSPEEPIDIPPPRPKRKPARPYPRKDAGDNSGSGNGDASGNNGHSTRHFLHTPMSNITTPGMPNNVADFEVSDTTVAAVAAAASAAAAAAAAAVVAAAGQSVQAHMQVHPPQGFPFFGVPPSLLQQMSNLPATSSDGLAGSGPYAQALPQNWKGLLGLADRAQALQAHNNMSVEATATTDNDRLSASVQTRDSDGDSACSRETSNPDGKHEQKEGAWRVWSQKDGTQSQMITSLQQKGWSAGLADFTNKRRMAVAADRPCNGTGSSMAANKRHHAPAKQEGTSGDQDESPSYSEDMREPNSPSIQEPDIKAPSHNTGSNGSGSNETDGSNGRSKSRATSTDPVREAQGSNPTNNTNGYGSSGNGNGRSNGNGQSAQGGCSNGMAGANGYSSGNGTSKPPPYAGGLAPWKRLEAKHSNAMYQRKHKDTSGASSKGPEENGDSASPSDRDQARAMPGGSRGFAPPTLAPPLAERPPAAAGVSDVAALQALLAAMQAQVGMPLTPYLLQQAYGATSANSFMMGLHQQQHNGLSQGLSEGLGQGLSDVLFQAARGSGLGSPDPQQLLVNPQYLGNGGTGMNAYGTSDLLKFQALANAAMRPMQMGAVGAGQSERQGLMAQDDSLRDTVAEHVKGPEFSGISAAALDGLPRSA